MNVPQDLRDTIGWIVLDSLPADVPVSTARSIIEGVTERVGAILTGTEPDSEPPPPPSPPRDEVEEGSQWPTVLILRRALMAVIERADYDEAMGVLIERALAASDWVEQYKEEQVHERGDVRSSASRGPLPDLSTPGHLSSR